MGWPLCGTGFGLTVTAMIPVGVGPGPGEGAGAGGGCVTTGGGWTESGDVGVSLQPLKTSAAAQMLPASHARERKRDVVVMIVSPQREFSELPPGRVRSQSATCPYDEPNNGLMARLAFQLVHWPHRAKGTACTNRCA